MAWFYEEDNREWREGLWQAAHPSRRPGPRADEVDAAEVRTLAAYVTALGFRLEIIAVVGDERIALR